MAWCASQMQSPEHTVPRVPGPLLAMEDPRRPTNRPRAQSNSARVRLRGRSACRAPKQCARGGCDASPNCIYWRGTNAVHACGLGPDRTAAALDAVGPAKFVFGGAGEPRTAPHAVSVLAVPRAMSWLSLPRPRAVAVAPGRVCVPRAVRVRRAVSVPVPRAVPVIIAEPCLCSCCSLRRVYGVRRDVLGFRSEAPRALSVNPGVKMAQLCLGLRASTQGVPK